MPRNSLSEWRLIEIFLVVWGKIWSNFVVWREFQKVFSIFFFFSLDLWVSSQVSGTCVGVVMCDNFFSSSRQSVTVSKPLPLLRSCSKVCVSDFQSTHGCVLASCCDSEDQKSFHFSDQQALIIRQNEETVIFSFEHLAKVASLNPHQHKKEENCSNRQCLPAKRLASWATFYIWCIFCFSSMPVGFMKCLWTSLLLSLWKCVNLQAGVPQSLHHMAVALEKTERELKKYFSFLLC